MQSLDSCGLAELMERAGTRLSSSEFIRAVSNAYHEIEAPEYDQRHPEIHDQAGSVLTHLVDAFPSEATDLNVLEVGSGTGLASHALLNVIGNRIRAMTCTDPSPAMLEQCARRFANSSAVRCRLADTAALRLEQVQYDLVLTCSVLHHLPDLGAFFDDLQSLLRPGGLYVMLHEPNRRFYDNRILVDFRAQYQEAAMRRRWKRFLNPQNYWNKLRRILRSEGGFAARLNSKLIEGGVITSPLAWVEIARLVDIHDPLVQPDCLGIGRRGLLLEEIGQEFLSGFELLGSLSYGGPGVTPDPNVPPRWEQAARDLAESFPADNISIAALWQKRAQSAASPSDADDGGMRN